MTLPAERQFNALQQAFIDNVHNVLVSEFSLENSPPYLVQEYQEGRAFLLAGTLSRPWISGSDRSAAEEVPRVVQAWKYGVQLRIEGQTDFEARNTSNALAQRLMQLISIMTARQKFPDLNEGGGQMQVQQPVQASKLEGSDLIEAYLTNVTASWNWSYPVDRLC